MDIMDKINDLNPTNRIEIETPFGILFAELSGDSDYHGIYICLEHEDDINGKYERQLALVECAPDIPNNGNHSLRLLAWRNDDNGDYTDSVLFRRDYQA